MWGRSIWEAGSNAFAIEQQGIECAGFGDEAGGLSGAGGGDQRDAGGDFINLLSHDRECRVVWMVVRAENEDVFSAGQAARSRFEGGAGSLRGLRRILGIWRRVVFHGFFPG